MSKNFIDRFYEEDIKDQFWSLNKIIGIGVALLLLTIIMINTTGCTQNLSEESFSMDLPANAAEPPHKGSVKVGNDGVNAAIAPDSLDNYIAAVPDKPLKNSTAKNTTTVTMSVEDSGRSDPFLPLHEAAAAAAAKAQKAKAKQVNPNLVPPPESLIVDSTATDVMTTKVSGIMFDKLNPSAILKIGGSDYLVRSGDIINGYKILSIAKDNVTVQYGANVYKAGVGELFTGDGINYNTVSNLESKFGGRKKKKKKK